MTVDELNQLDEPALLQVLKACCHCDGWSRRVARRRPFESESALFAAAEQEWQRASEQEILEAFSGHPQIGDLDALRNRYAATASAEQGQVTTADESTLARLRDRNLVYLDRFGFIFIVCASGKSAAEMLALLEARIDNSRDEELGNGAVEQGKITRLRLEKLLKEN